MMSIFIEPDKTKTTKEAETFLGAIRLLYVMERRFGKGEPQKLAEMKKELRRNLSHYIGHGPLSGDGLQRETKTSLKAACDNPWGRHTEKVGTDEHINTLVGSGIVIMKEMDNGLNVWLGRDDLSGKKFATLRRRIGMPDDVTSVRTFCALLDVMDADAKRGIKSAAKARAEFWTRPIFSIDNEAKIKESIEQTKRESKTNKNRDGSAIKRRTRASEANSPTAFKAKPQEAARGRR